MCIRTRSLSNRPCRSQHSSHTQTQARHGCKPRVGIGEGGPAAATRNHTSCKDRMYSMCLSRNKVVGTSSSPPPIMANWLAYGHTRSAERAQSGYPSRWVNVFQVQTRKGARTRKGGRTGGQHSRLRALTIPQRHPKRGRIVGCSQESRRSSATASGG